MDGLIRGDLRTKNAWKNATAFITFNIGEKEKYPMRHELGRHMLRITGIAGLFAASTALGGELVPHSDPDVKLSETSKYILLSKAKVLSERPESGSGPSPDPTTANACETVGRRSYELCMASPDPDRERCLRAYDDTYRACSDPSGVVDESKGKSSDTKLSQGTYRIPYADGTKVHISRDFYDHNPPGKIDMSGRGGGPYRIVAAAAGQIRYIEDGRSKQQHPERWLRNTDDCFNNYVWIEHENGEWSKYSHMQMGTTTAKAKLKVGDYVAEGTYLGDEGKVGCAWPAHLHFEIVVPSSENPGIADPSGKLRKYSDEQARNPLIAGIEGGTFKDGENYIVGAGPKCQKDSDCDEGQWCNAGLDLTKNACLPLKNDNDTCDLAGGGHQCKSGKCKFSRCYTPDSVAMGKTCYVNDACKAGKCSDVEGVKGVCVCKTDSDCGAGEWCDAGLDLKINACRAKLAKGQSCGKVGSVGNDHKCKSGECSGFPKYECK